MKKKVSYTDFVQFFGSPGAVAKHFNIKVQAVYQWKEDVPVQRAREYELLKRMEASDVISR